MLRDSKEPKDQEDHKVLKGQEGHKVRKVHKEPKVLKEVQRELKVPKVL